MEMGLSWEGGRKEGGEGERGGREGERGKWEGERGKWEGERGEREGGRGKGEGDRGEGVKRWKMAGNLKKAGNLKLVACVFWSHPQLGDEGKVSDINMRRIS